MNRSDRILAVIGLAAAGALIWTEKRRALRTSRPRVRNRQRERVATNVTLAGLTAVVSQGAMAPAVSPLTRWVERDRIGLTQRLPVSPWLRDAVAVLLLDYTLYWWHVLEHRIPWLYRFHQVHHADLALDSSTAIRFHFGEFVASIPWRAAQVVVIGVSPRALMVWQRLTMTSVLFHHSNVRLSIGAERTMAAMIMTPRLHGIHHSIVRDEQDSNWSSGLTIWDRLHGTYLATVPQQEIEIGIAARREPGDVTLTKSLTMPLERASPWPLPDGTTPRPLAHRSAEAHLLA